MMDIQYSFDSAACVLDNDAPFARESRRASKLLPTRKQFPTPKFKHPSTPRIPAKMQTKVLMISGSHTINYMRMHDSRW